MDAVERFVRELRIRNYSPRTIASYRTRIAAFFAFLNDIPSTISSEDVKRFLDVLQQRGASPQLLNLTIQAIKTYTSMVLHAPLGVEVCYAKRPHRLPVVLSRE